MQDASAVQKSSAPISAATTWRDFPNCTSPQVLRHFLRLSHLNFAQALQFYPLGSCTMKYNPLLNDEMASLRGFAGLHPRTPAHLAQGALELMARLEAALAEITGMDAVTLHPAAGAQGELTGLMMIRAYHQLARRAAPQGDNSGHRAWHQSRELHAGRFRGEGGALEQARFSRGVGNRAAAR